VPLYLASQRVFGSRLKTLERSDFFDSLDLCGTEFYALVSYTVGLRRQEHAGRLPLQRA